MSRLVSIALLAVVCSIGCASPEQKALNHLEQVVKILERSCGDAPKSTRCANPDKAGDEIRTYYAEHKKEIGEIKRQLQDKEQSLAKDPARLHAWEEKYREPIKKLTGRIARLMKKYPNLRSHTKVKEALRKFR